MKLLRLDEIEGIPVFGTLVWKPVRQDARRDGVRHQRVHGGERGRRGRRGAHRAATRPRGDLRRHLRPRDVHRRRRGGRRARGHARLPRRRRAEAARDRAGARHDGARDRRRPGQARDLVVGVLLPGARADARTATTTRRGASSRRASPRRTRRCALPARVRRGPRRQPRARARRAAARGRRRATGSAGARRPTRTSRRFATIRAFRRSRRAASAVHLEMASTLYVLLFVVDRCTTAALKGRWLLFAVRAPGRACHLGARLPHVGAPALVVVHPRVRLTMKRVRAVHLAPFRRR